MNHKHHKPSMKSETGPLELMNRDKFITGLRKPKIQVADIN